MAKEENKKRHRDTHRENGEKRNGEKEESKKERFNLEMKEPHWPPLFLLAVKISRMIPLLQ